MRVKLRDAQGELYSVRLYFLCNEAHPLARLSEATGRSRFDQAFGNLYSEGWESPAIPTQFMVGLSYLKHAKGLSGEEVLAQWLENAY